jgi:hypothetical protein
LICLKLKFAGLTAKRLKFGVAFAALCAGTCELAAGGNAMLPKASVQRNIAARKCLIWAVCSISIYRNRRPDISSGPNDPRHLLTEIPQEMVKRSATQISSIIDNAFFVD